MNAAKHKLLIITASTRQNRVGQMVADWAAARTEADDWFEVARADLLALKLPEYNEPDSPSNLKDGLPHAAQRAWSQLVAAQDAYMMVMPEYNHGYSAPLKNALDTLYSEWNRKPVGLVGYSNGFLGGARALEQIKLVLDELGIAVVRPSVNLAKVLPDQTYDFAPYEKGLDAQLASLQWWSAALKPAREAGA